MVKNYIFKKKSVCITKDAQCINITYTNDVKGLYWVSQ